MERSEPVCVKFEELARGPGRGIKRKWVIVLRLVFGYEGQMS